MRPLESPTPPTSKPRGSPVGRGRQLRFPPIPHAANTWLAAAMRGARSRRPDASTRGGVAHLRFFQATGLKEEEAAPSPRRSQTASAPALLDFWNLPHAGARRRMRSGERGRGARTAHLQPRGATREARGRLFCPPRETASTPRPAPLPSGPPLLRVPPPAHLGDLPLQTPK